MSYVFLTTPITDGAVIKKKRNYLKVNKIGGGGG